MEKLPQHLAVSMERLSHGGSRTNLGGGLGEEKPQPPGSDRPGFKLQPNPLLPVWLWRSISPLSYNLLTWEWGRYTLQGFYEITFYKRHNAIPITNDKYTV